ncbi:DUF6880 family protein [Hoeflea marina]|nr:DUF6880 family protein [Hoeflea marina]
MAAKTTLNAKNLETLGAPRLAELLIEISTGSADRKRRLRMELAGGQGSAEVVREVRKRLVSLGRARGRIGWRKVRTLKADLEMQRKTIVETVAQRDPSEAFDLVWQFLRLSDTILTRTADSNGTLMASFRQAIEDACGIALAAGLDADSLTPRVFAALQDNDHGQYDRMITTMAPALGADGLTALKLLVCEWLEEPPEKPASGGQVSVRGRRLAARTALQEIADAQGDVDSYIAHMPGEHRGAPMIATDIADRLLAAGRADEALEALDRVDVGGRIFVPIEWELARARTLEALERADEAQAFRWARFERSLSAEHLRAYLRRLPDFDDVEAEEKAFARARAFPDVHEALAFFLSWPAPAEAARLVEARSGKLDCDLYPLLSSAAESLGAIHPLAATILLRAMIDFTLEHARSSRYRHAARHLADCAALAPHIEDHGSLAPHDAYVAGLRLRHGRKHGFWSHVA